MPQGISVNCCLVHPKGKTVLVISMNQNDHNIWIWQPLLAAEIYWVEHLPWDYGVEFQHQGNITEVVFQPIPPADIMATVKLVHDEPGTKPSADPHHTCDSQAAFTKRFKDVFTGILVLEWYILLADETKQRTIPGPKACTLCITEAIQEGLEWLQQPGIIKLLGMDQTERCKSLVLLP